MISLNYENWIKEEKKDIYFELKGIIESFLEKFGEEIVFEESERTYFDFCAKIIMKNEEIGVIGIVSEDIKKFYDLKDEIAFGEISIEKLRKKGRVIYEPLPVYPSLSRDLSFVGPENVKASVFLKLLKELKKETLIEEFRLIDVYKGKPLKQGEKNFTFRVYFRSPERTLKERDVDKEVEKIVKYIKEKTGFRLRG